MSLEQTDRLIRDAGQILKRVNLPHFGLLFWQGVWPTEKKEKRTVDET